MAGMVELVQARFEFLPGFGVTLDFKIVIVEPISKIKREAVATLHSRKKELGHQGFFSEDDVEHGVKTVMFVVRSSVKGVAESLGAGSERCRGVLENLKADKQV